MTYDEVFECSLDLGFFRQVENASPHFVALVEHAQSIQTQHQFRQLALTCALNGQIRGNAIFPAFWRIPGHTGLDRPEVLASCAMELLACASGQARLKNMVLFIT